MGFDNRAADREAHAHAVGLRRVEWFKETRQSFRAQPGAGVLHPEAHRVRFRLAGSDEHLSGAVSNRTIAWTALRMRLRTTCCSWTRSPWMRGRPSASCVRTETPCFSASPWVSSSTSRNASFRSTLSVRVGAFCMSARMPAHDVAGPVVVLHSAGKRFPDLHQIRRRSV